MQLRFVDEPLKPRFDLEMVGADTIVAKVHVRAPERRAPLPAHQRRLVRGRAGLAHRHQRGHRAAARSSRFARGAAPPAAQPDHRRAGFRADQHDHYGPAARSRSKIGAQLPDLSQVADVIDLEPTFRMRAGGSLTEVAGPLTRRLRRPGGRSARRRHLAAGDDPAAGGRAEARASASAATSPPSSAPWKSCSTLGLEADESGEYFIADGDDAIQFWSEGVGSLPEDWDLYVPEELVGTQVRGKPVRCTRASRAAWTG